MWKEHFGSAAARSLILKPFKTWVAKRRLQTRLDIHKTATLNTKTDEHIRLLFKFGEVLGHN